MTSGTFGSVPRPRDRRKSQSARLRMLASQSEAALDRSETFLRNQDPKRSFARAKPSDLPLLRGIALHGLDQIGNEIGARLILTDTCGTAPWRFLMRSHLRSAARPIASLHGSLRMAKCFLTHNKMRPAVGLMAGHRSWISVPQASRTAAILTSAALQGSVKSWKCALTHSMSGPRPGWAGAQATVTSRLHACMTVAYWPKAGDTDSSTNIAKAK